MSAPHAAGELPRIVLVSAGQVSMPPADRAFRAGWPQVEPIHVLDESLSTDGARLGPAHPDIVARFEHLGRYAALMGAEALLFTCSAFAQAIGRVRCEQAFPVLTPNEALFDRLLATRGRTAVLVTFPASLEALRTELEAQATLAGVVAQVDFVWVPDAFGAPDHDQKVVDQCVKLAGRYQALALGQFSMARALEAARAACPIPVWDTPGTAVEKLRAGWEARSRGR
jgi:hypothetical protein